MNSTTINGQGAARSTPLASPSALVKNKDGEPGMSGGSYSLDDGLNEPDKTHECRLRVENVKLSMCHRCGEGRVRWRRWWLGGGLTFVAFRSQDGRVRVLGF